MVCMAVGSFHRWGQMESRDTKKIASHMAAAQTNSGFSGQVEPESNLQPAVLELAALHSAAFRDVHEVA
jgi:hypothetical protein